MIGNAVDKTYKAARRVAVAVVGSTVLLVGVALIVLPGPAFVVIPVGLAILSIEFAWARLWLRKIRRSISGQSANSRSSRAEAHRDRVSR
ncbi:MAG: PGPGW domain-containing protein [Woeseiaceae bacterium]